MGTAMSPAPLTPNTINKIRTESRYRQAPDIANDLGWELSRLRRVAQSHSIELVNAAPTMAQQTLSDSLKKETEKPMVKYRPGGANKRVSIDHNMSLDEIIYVLPPQQADVIKVLKTEVDGRFLHAREICKASGLDPEFPIAQAINKAAHRLRTSNAAWRIQTRMGPNGGHRLVVA
jgi:hypothetical protein